MITWNRGMKRLNGLRSHTVRRVLGAMRASSEWFARGAIAKNSSLVALNHAPSRMPV